MKYIVVNDEHELYRNMFSELFSNNKYNIEEIERMVIPKLLMPFYKLHFNEKINRHFSLPFKRIWKNCYRLHKYPFTNDENYCILLLNGSLKYHFSRRYLENIKKDHPNVKFVMIMYDSYSNPSAKRAISMIPVFDYIFSFDEEDCKREGFERIYSTFSKPNFVHEDHSKKSKAFFIGFGQGRLELLQNSFRKITKEVDDCQFYIAGVKKEDIVSIKDVIYNKTMPYAEELQYAYNTECIVEIVRDGQTGVSLRTCEAIAFNKKLLTNNVKLKNMPFYDEKYMKIFSSPKDIDIDFIKNDIKVCYDNNDYFSPIRIIDRIEAIEQAK